MKPNEMAMHCLEQMQRFGTDADLVLVVPGRWPKGGRKRLFGKQGGPWGQVVGERGDNTCVCMFKAIEVLAALRVEIEQVGPTTLEVKMPC